MYSQKSENYKKNLIHEAHIIYRTIFQLLANCAEVVT